MTNAPALPLTDAALLRHECYINGVWTNARSVEAIPVDNPSTCEAIGAVPNTGLEGLDEAVKSAADAFLPWHQRPAKERAAALRRWGELVTTHQEDLARIVTLEQGKPISESRREVLVAAAFLEWSGEEAKRTSGEVMPGHHQDKRLLVLKQPIGVVACITPWNFPLAMVTRKVAPAVAVGCTTVLKPASQTPFSALALAELASRAGIPAGVLNVVTGHGSQIGRLLVAHQGIRKISFTGSTDVGKRLIRESADGVKRLTLELGGNAPFIVFDDADIDSALQGVMASKFFNSGQTCISANRVYVHDRIYSEFAQALTRLVSSLRPGDGFDERATQGPLIDDRAVLRVEEQVRDALARGASVLTGGRRHALAGRFFEPTVLSEVTASCRIASEETFGPVAALIRFGTESEVVQLSNDTEYGLAAYVYSHDIRRAWRIAEALECGMVGVNTVSMLSESAPFGGIKASGIGREGSKYGTESFLEVKYLCLGGMG